MLNFPIPENEDERLAALHRYQVLDSPPEAAFDTITRTLSKLLDVPIALVTLLDHDRQWFKSRHGLEETTETPRDQAFCSHTIMRDEVFIVPDAHDNPKFRNNPLVTGPPYIRFYAGAPLITPDGFRLGSLCAIDRRPRKGLTDDEQDDLVDLADLVVDQIELRSLRNALMTGRQ